MVFWPVRTTSAQTLSDATEKEIKRRVAEKFYDLLKNENYLESGYIAEVANELLKNTDLGISFVANENSNDYKIISRKFE